MRTEILLIGVCALVFACKEGCQGAETVIAVREMSAMTIDERDVSLMGKTMTTNEGYSFLSECAVYVLPNGTKINEWDYFRGMESK